MFIQIYNFNSAQERGYPIHCNAEFKTKNIRVDVLGEACGAEITERLLLPTVIGMSTDSVANVR